MMIDLSAGRRNSAAIASLFVLVSAGGASTARQAHAQAPDVSPGKIEVGAPGQAPVTATSFNDALVQARRLHRGAAPVTITLPPGIVRLRQPLALGPADSGLVITGAADGGTTLSGAVIIQDGPRAGRSFSYPLGHPTALVGFMFGKAGPARNPLIFQSDRQIQFGAWPSRGYDSGWTLTPEGRGSILTYTKGPLPEMPQSVLVSGYFIANWAYEVVQGHPQGNEIVLPDYQAQFPPKSPPRLRILNVAAALPLGRMSLDVDSGVLTINPALDGAPIELAVAPSVLAISGAHDVKLERIRFEKTTAAAVQIDKAQRIVLDQCSVGLTGREGIIVTSSTDVVVQRCVLRGLGGSGVVVSAGDRTTLTPGGVTVTDSVIEQFSTDIRTYQPAVVLTGVGDKVEHSLIGVAPHNAVMLGGNEQTVEANEITAVVCETDDASAVYMGRDWTMRGMRVVGNFIHDIGGQVPGAQPIGVYLDDEFSGAEISRNVFLRMTWGVLLGGGRDNHINDNVFASMKGAAVHYDARGMGQKPSLNAGLMAKFTQSPYRSRAWTARYPTLAALPGDHPGAPVGNIATGDVLVESAWLKGPDGGFPLGGAPGKPVELAADALAGPIEQQHDTLAALIGGQSVGPRGSLLYDRYEIAKPSCADASP